MRILLLSGGKDSVATLFVARKEIDIAVFNDTGAEFPEIYGVINELKREITIVTLKPKFTLLEYMTVYRRKRGKYKGYPYFSPTIHYRWCTMLLKKVPLRKFLKQFDKATLIVGFNADEKRRAKLMEYWQKQGYEVKFPLMERGITARKSLEIAKANGITWNGLYERFSRTGCWACPFHNKRGRKNLMCYYPELWNKIKEIEQYWKTLGVEWKYYPDKSIQELEEELKLCGGEG